MNNPCRSIKNDYQFRRAYTKGTSAVTPALVSYCFRRKNGGITVGITTGKKVGNAVKRNRARRVIREAARELKPFMSGSWEIVFVARTRTPFKKTPELVEEMRAQLTALGVIKKMN